MTDDEPDLAPKFNQLHPDFLIPPGTQVVLKTDIPLNLEHQKERLVKAGTVGVIKKTPTDNSQPYRIQLQDESEISVMFEQLSIRRREIDDSIGEIENLTTRFRPYVIFSCIVGSRAFGLSHEESDEDIRGIFLPPAEWHWSLKKVPEQVEILKKPSDEVYWELEKFIRLALKANPNVLEVLWSPMVKECTQIGEELRNLRTAFLSRHIYKTYSGYVLSQFRRMKNAYEKTGAYKTKHGMHLIRLLYSGIECLRTGEIRVDVSEHCDELLAIKSGTLNFEAVRQKALTLDQEFQTAFQQTTLPEQPNFQLIDEFLISARRAMTEISSH